MGGEKREESGFGFKDREKALETLRLLQEQDAGYRALTVRGLLARARRVLSMTKAEEKVKNIKEAIAVFEDWQQQQKDAKSADKGNESTEKDKKKQEKKQQEKKQQEKKRDAEVEEGEMEVDETNSKDEKKEQSKADTVPGLGFKDAAAARASLQVLEGRDPNYQKLAVKGLLGRAERTLAVTRDETKKNNIKEAKEILEKYLEDWEREGRGGKNMNYLPLDVVLSCLQLATQRGIQATREQTEFVEAYRGVEGDYKRLRTVQCGDARTWDVARNAALAELRARESDAQLSTAAAAEGGPSAAHLQLALWAYSPAPDKLRQLVAAASAPAPTPRPKRPSSPGDKQHSPAKKTKA